MQGVKAGTAMLLLVGVIPLLYGFLLEVVVLMPVRVPLNQSPVYFIWQVSSHAMLHVFGSLFLWHLLCLYE